MGEMADYYIDRMIGQHMNPHHSFPQRSMNTRMEKYKGMDDQELIRSAQKAIRGKGYNEAFYQTAQKIVKEPLNRLSEKQRSCLLGLLNVQEDKSIHLQNLSDAELLALSRKAVDGNLFNEDFAFLAKKLVNDSPNTLSVKQRNALIGFLSW